VKQNVFNAGRNWSRVRSARRRSNGREFYRRGPDLDRKRRSPRQVAMRNDKRGYREREARSY